MSRYRTRNDRDSGSALRYMATTGIVVALYATAETVVPTFRARPGLLVATVLFAAVLGILVAAWQERFSPPRSRGRAQRRGAAAFAAFGMAGLVGASLILAQSLTAGSAQWLFLGMSGLTSGAAGHAWCRDRQPTVSN